MSTTSVGDCDDGQVIRLPAELWWLVLKDLIIASLRDRFTLALTCRHFCAIVVAVGDLPWIEHARAHDLHVLLSQGETVEAVLRARVEFSRCGSRLPSDIGGRSLADAFAPLYAILLDRSASSRNIHGLAAFVNHVWPIVNCDGRVPVVFDARTTVLLASARAAIAGWCLPDGDPQPGRLCIAKEAHAHDSSMMMACNAHTWNTTYFYEGADIPLRRATIIDGFERDVGDVVHAIEAAVRALYVYGIYIEDILPLKPIVDTMARLCCGKKALVLVYRDGGENPTALVSAAYYGAMRHDDRAIAWKFSISSKEE